LQKRHFKLSVNKVSQKSKINARKNVLQAFLLTIDYTHQWETDIGSAMVPMADLALIDSCHQHFTEISRQ